MEFVSNGQLVFLPVVIDSNFVGVVIAFINIEHRPGSGLPAFSQIWNYWIAECFKSLSSFDHQWWRFSGNLHVNNINKKWINFINEINTDSTCNEPIVHATNIVRMNVCEYRMCTFRSLRSKSQARPYPISTFHPDVQCWHSVCDHRYFLNTNQTKFKFEWNGQVVR